MIDKLKLIKAEATEDFIFAESDIVFLKPSLSRILQEIAFFDVLFQDDGPRPLCAGLFVMRVNEKTLAFLDDWRSRAEAALTQPDENGRINDDQDVLNKFIQDSGLTYGKLSHLFANPYTVAGKIWDGSNLNIPNDTLVFHANWTEGIENKEKLLDMALTAV
jgi:hypothetical protein